MKTIITTYSILILLSFCSVLYAQPFAGGSGTEADPWQIETPQQLDSIRHYLDGYFMLTNDVDLEQYNNGIWTPIGNEFDQFVGVLNGQNFIISNINTQYSDADYSGLFGYLNGTIQNLKIQSAHITGIISGILAGWGGGVIENVHTQGSIDALDYAGGIVGASTVNLEINESSSDVIINSVLGFLDNPNVSIVGGLIGTIADYDELVQIPSNISISNSYSTGEISNRDSRYSGGIVGQFYDGTIRNSYSSYVGDLISDLYGTNIIPLVGGGTNFETTTFGEVINSYWDSGTDSSITDSTLGLPLSSESLRNNDSFAGWDFDSTWVQGDLSGSSFPYLQSYTPPSLPGYQPLVDFSGPFAGGSGTEADPWHIETPEQLDSIRLYLANHFILNNDIDLSNYTGNPSGGSWNDGKGWEPIGIESQSTCGYDGLEGSFDGSNYTIIGLYINRPNECFVGLFRSANFISNLSLTDIDIKGKVFIGGLAGSGTDISNSSVSGVIKSDGNDGVNSAAPFDDSIVGGLLGLSTGRIDSSWTEVIIQIDGEIIGGLVGSYLTGEGVFNSFSNSQISSDDERIGGLIGEFGGDSLVNSYFTGAASGTVSVGGVVGRNFGVIANSYSSGNVYGSYFNDLYYYGGLVGDNNGTILSSYSTATTSDNDSFNPNGGGLVGVNNGTVISSYWDEELSGTVISDAGVGLKSAEMRQPTSFLSWDFEKIWQIYSENPFSYPYLKNNPPDSIPGLIYGGALDFNGSTSFATIPDTSDIDLSDALTIELWVNFDDIDRSSSGEEFMTLFVKDVVPGSYGLILNTSTADNTLTFYHQGLSSGGTSFDWTDITDSTWYHVAVTYDGTKATIYIDGAERASQNVTGSIATNNSDLLIGKYGGMNTYSLDGAIADFRIWNDARTQAEIQNNMNLLISGKEQNLVGNWIPRIAGYEGGLDFAENTIPISYTDVSIVDTTFPPLKMSFEGAEGWRFIGAPGDSSTYDELLDPIWTQGFTGADASGGSSNVYFYEESTRSWKTPQSSSNLFGTQSSDTSALGKGALVYVYADDDFDGTDDPFPKTLSLDKKLFILYDETIPVSYTESDIWGNDGWNLVSNPYPVSLYWLEIVADSANKNIEPYIFIWDHSMFGGYGGYAANYGTASAPGLPGSANFDGRIAPFQSFWVKANAANAELQLTKDHFITNTQAFKNQPESNPFLIFRLEGNGFQNESSVLFKDRIGDTPGIPKLSSLSPQYADIYFGDPIGQKWLAKYETLTADSVYSIPLYTDITVNGEFELSWDINSVPSLWLLELENLATGSRIDLRKSDKISIINEQSTKKSPHSYNSTPPAPGNFGKQKRAAASDYILHISNTIITNNELLDNIPEKFGLSQNYPNPFNPTTIIDFALPVPSHVKLEVFDILGRKVATLLNEPMQAGFHNVVFEAGGLASGVYIYRIQAGSFTQTKSFTLVK